jgi:hypothetical protein
MSSCSSPKAYSGLATGSHTYKVAATDAAGNTDATPATATWTISAPPPPPPPSSCTQHVSTTTALQSAVNTAGAGQTICLDAGTYGHFEIKNRVLSDYLTVEPSSGASVSFSDGFLIQGSSHIRLQGLVVHGAGYYNSVFTSDNIQVLDSDFSNDGFTIRATKNSLFKGNNIHDIADATAAPGGYGMWVNSYYCCNSTVLNATDGLDGLVIEDNTFHNIPEDGIQLGGGPTHHTRDVTIKGNTFDTVSAISTTAHSDSIQIIGGDNITVADNTFRHVQDACMFKDDTLSNSTVENNLMVGDTDARSGVGILCQIWDATNLTVLNNTVWQYGTYPALMLRHSGSAVVENNISNKGITVETGVTASQSNNIIDPSFKFNAGGFTLPAGSPAIDAASTHAPSTDILGNSRYDNTSVPNASGSAADIGAFERTTN